MSEGSEFHLAFFNNLQINPFLSQADIRVCVSNIDEISQNIEFSYNSNVDRIDIDPGSSVNSDLPVDLRLQDIGEMDKGISIRSTNGTKLSVTALSNE